MPDLSQPFAGLRVIEIGHVVAAPTVGLIMGDLGAEVVKIERREGGDTARKMGGPGAGAYPFYNRNKSSVTIDLKTEQGRKVLKRLVRVSDVLVENFSSGTMEKLGLDYPTLREINPRLVYASLKGFGTGPYSKLPSLDEPIQVLSGLSYMTGLEGQPLRTGVSIVDITAALFTVISIMAALEKRRRTGRGTEIKCGLFETAAFLVGPHIMTHQISGKKSIPLNVSKYGWGVYDYFVSKDGVTFFIAVVTDAEWIDFCKIFGLSDLLNNPSLETNPDRFRNRDLTLPIIKEKLKNFSASELRSKLAAAEIPFAKLNTPEDLLNDDHMLSDDKFLEIRYGGKSLMVPGLPVEIEGRIFSKVRLAPPDLGSDTTKVLAEIGFLPAEIERFEREEII